MLRRECTIKLQFLIRDVKKKKLLINWPLKMYRLVEV